MPYIQAYTEDEAETKIPKLKNLSEKQNYYLFGTVLNLKGDLYKENSLPNNYKLLLSKVTSNYKALKELIILNTNKADWEFLSLIRKNEQKKFKIEDYIDLNIPTLVEIDFSCLKQNKNTFSVQLVKNEFTTEIFLTICCLNVEFIIEPIIEINNENLKPRPGKLRSLNSETVQTCSVDSVTFVYSCPNKLIMENNFTGKLCLKEDLDCKCEIKSTFNQIKIEFCTKGKKFQKGFSQKQANIETMSLDLLYLYAVSYVNIFSKINDENILKRCQELRDILQQIDNIWKLKDRTHEYNEKKKKKNY